MPEAAKEKSEKGIVAFTKHWFDALGYMYVTNETRQLKSITRPQCEICARSFIDPADGLAKNGAWSVGGELKATVTLAVSKGNSGVATFRLEREDLLVYDKKAEYYGKLPGTKTPDIGTLMLEYDDGWQVIDLQWLDAE
jgi:hypothetical protein